jgi:arylsulfatase
LDKICTDRRDAATVPPHDGAQMMRLSHVTILACGLLAASRATAQSRPDFSGRWAAEPPAPTPSARDVAAGTRPPAKVDLGSGWGRAITITQDDRTFVVEWPFFSTYDLQPPLRFVYALDGSETVNTVMMGRGLQKQRGRATWNGTSLVLITTHSFPDPNAGRPVESEVRQTLTLESPTSLVVETVRAGVLGGPSSTSRTVYAKGGGA